MSSPQMQPEERGETRSTSEILRDTIADLEGLIRAEIQLAKAELKQEARKTVIAAALFIAGGIITMYGFAFALVAIYVAMSHAIWNWLAASVIAAFLLLLGLAVAGGGFRTLRRLNLMPEKTLEVLKKGIRRS